MDTFIKAILIIGLSFVVHSCKEDKPYQVYWDNDKLCVVMPHPTVGIVGIGMVSWGNVELSDVLEDMYKEIKNSSYTECSLYVRFKSDYNDKYGNPIVEYDDHYLMSIPVSEARKYRSGEFLDKSYGIESAIYNAAFPKDEQNNPYSF